MAEIDMSTHTQRKGMHDTDRQWVNVFPGEDPFLPVATSRAHSIFHAGIIGTSPGMAVSMVDKGAKYPGVFRDKDRRLPRRRQILQRATPRPGCEFLVHHPLLMHSLLRSGLDNGQPFPSLNSMDKPTQNADGSFDLHFGADHPRR